MKIIPSPSIVSGRASIQELPGIIRDLGARKLFLVTDKGIVKSGICRTVLNVIETLGFEVQVDDEVLPDPSIDLVQRIVDTVRRSRVDAIIGLGGGSSLDAAKVAAALIGSARRAEQCIGTDQIEAPGIPMIAMPTTAGTGSEVTNIAILSDEKAGLKKAIVSNHILPRCAVLDPDLTVGLPGPITATTGMDALCHAIESFTSLRANEYSNLLALKAMELLSAHIERAFEDGTDLHAREAMLLGSLFAGLAFANAGVTAVHAFAYPLGGMFHVPHGLANSLMLPSIMRFNSVGNEELFSRVGRVLTGGKEAVQGVVGRIEELSRKLRLPQNLAAAGIPEDAIQKMAAAAVQNTRLLSNNPRKILLEDAVAIYEQAYGR